MFSSIDEFIKYIPNFNNLSSGERIPFFVYFCSQKSGKEVTPKEIKECYDTLLLPTYSNISAYLSKKTSGGGAPIKQYKMFSLKRHGFGHAVSSLHKS